VWLMRGIPREAVENRLPIAGSNYTCDQAVRLDANCSWNSHTYGSNGSPAAAAYYASLAAKLVSWGITLVKMDCLWPHLYEGTPQPYFNEDVEGASTALKSAGLLLSMSPGISVSPANASYIAAASRAPLYRIAEDVLDVYEGKPDGSFPQGLHQKFTKALEFEAFLGANGTTPDFDMLQVGRVVHGYDRAHELPPTETHLTPTEQATSFSLFCFTGVPLIVGGRLPLDSSPNGTATLALLTQRELLGVHNASASRRSFTPTLATTPTTTPHAPGFFNSSSSGSYANSPVQRSRAELEPQQQEAAAAAAAELYGWVNTPSDPSGRIPPGDVARFVGVWNAGEGGGVGVSVRFVQDAALPPNTQQVCVRDLGSGVWEEPVGGDLGGGVYGLSTSVEDHGGRTLLLTTLGSPVCRTGLA
jgi:hypothetical protein